MGSQASGDHFESGLGVIVEAPDHARIDRKLHVEFLKIAFDLVKMGVATVTEMIKHSRCRDSCVLTARHFAIQNPQRVVGVASLTVCAEDIESLLQEFDKCLTVARTTLRTAERVDLQGDVRDFCRGKIMAEHGQNLGVDLRIINAYHFRADLVKLAIAAFLRALVPEHRPDVIKLRYRVLGVQLVLDKRTHDRSSSLRA